MSETDRPAPIPLEDFQPWCDGMADGLVLADLATERFLRANAAMCRMLGYTEAELLALSVRDIHPEDDWRRVATAFASAHLGDIGRLENIVCLRKDGSTFPADVMGNVVTHRGRRCALGLFRDITAQHHAVKLIELQRDLGIALCSARGLDEALRLVLEAGLEIEGFDCGGIYLVDAGTGEIELRGHAGLSSEFVEAARRFPPDSPEAAVLAAGKPVYGRGCDASPPGASLLRGEGLRATAVVPLYDEDRVIGSLNFGSRRSDEVSLPSRHALEAMGARLGSVIARIRAEESREESERRYRLIAENVADVIWTMELRGIDETVALGRRGDVAGSVLATWRFTYLSPSVERLLGYPPDEAIGLRLDELLTPESYREMGRLLRRDVALEAEAPEHAFPRRTLEVSMRRKDGEEVWCEVTVTFLREADGPPRRAVGVVRDISARRRAEIALSEHETRLRTLIENLPDLLLVLDAEGVIRFANRDLQGGPVESMIGKDGFELVAPEQRREARRSLRRALRTRQTLVVEHRDVFGRWHSARVVPLDGEGKPRQAMIIATDVTLARQAAQTIEKERQLLRQLLDLHERDRQMTAYEIHDGLTQQLTGAIYQFEAAVRLQSQSPERARKAFDEGLRLATQGVAEARRLISGLRPPILDEAGIVAALDYVVCEWRQRGGREIEFHAAVGFDRLAPPLETAIFRIVQESLSNACRHSGSDRVRVELIEQDGRVHLNVADWGAGFDPNHVDPRCFGLRGIRERVRLLGGRASIITAAGKGTRVNVELPIVGAPARD